MRLYSGFYHKNRKVKDNPYKILEITEMAPSQTDIKRAYQRLALKYHPDKNKNSEESRQKFIEIVEAYETLAENQVRGNCESSNSIYYRYYECMNLINAILRHLVTQLSGPANQ
jgi:DnaJ-domain-containing protein 1